MTVFTKLLAILAVCGGAWAWGAEALTPEEKGKQDEFRKLYSSNEKQGQLSALERLDGAVHPSSRDMLFVVCSTSTIDDVKTAAYARMAAMPQRDASVSVQLAGLFRDVKPNDVDVKVAYVKAAKASEFKYALYEAFCEYGSKLRYPDLFTDAPRNNGGKKTGGTGTTGGDPNFYNRKQRAEFQLFVNAFNEVAGSKIKPDDKNSPVQFRKWWDEERTRLLRLDQEIAAKYAAADREKRAKVNPLLPGGKKDEGGDAKPEGAAKAAEPAKDAKP
jgi:hypothetical protein